MQDAVLDSEHVNCLSCYPRPVGVQSFGKAFNYE